MEKDSNPTNSKCVGTPTIRKPRIPRKGELAAKKKGQHDKLNEFYKKISDASGFEPTQVRQTLDAVRDTIVAQLGEHGKSEIPNLVSFRIKDTKALPAKVEHAFNKEIHFAARPASKRIHPLILQPLRNAMKPVDRQSHKAKSRKRLI